MKMMNMATISLRYLLFLVAMVLCNIMDVNAGQIGQRDSSGTLTVKSLETTFGDGVFDIVAMAIINDNMYAIRDYFYKGHMAYVEQYDAVSRSFKRNMTLNQIFDYAVRGMAGSIKCNRLYITQAGKDRVYTMDLSKPDQTTWWEACEDPTAVSIAKDGCNVIVTCTKGTTINEYTPEGRLVRIIWLPKISWSDMWQADELPNGRFMILRHRDDRTVFTVICIVDISPDELASEEMVGISFEGTMTKCSDESATVEKEPTSHFAVDKFGSVIITDKEGMIMLLDSSLTYVKDLVKSIGVPTKIYVDAERSRLYVVTVFNNVEVYEIKYE